MERLVKQNGETANSQHTAQAKFTSKSRENALAASPMMVAQRQQLQSLFGGAAQLKGKEEEPLQTKHALGEEEFLPGKYGVQQHKGKEEEPLQGKFAFSFPVQREQMPAAMLGAEGVAQAKTDVKQDLKDGTDDETSSKLINTPTLGTAWFRFKKEGDVIDSFADNIYSGPGPKGGTPVTTTVELGAAASKKGIEKSDIPSMSRARHFSLGDEEAGITKDGDRKGKRTWHHKQATYEMELVDMYTHGGFFHYGGFSAWQEGIDDNDN